jgi:hypothetical protein
MQSRPGASPRSYGSTKLTTIGQKELDKLLSRFDLPKDGSVKDKKCMLLNKIGCNLSFEDITNAR